MKKFGHYLVTRFNLGLYRMNNDPDKWFSRRIKIFKNMTLESLRVQTWQNFTLVVLVDAETPEDHLEKLSKLLTKNSYYPFKIQVLFIAIGKEWNPKRYGERVSCEISYRELKDFLFMECKHCLQTRIDNDDALMPDAVEKIQGCAPKINMSYLLDYDEGFLVDSVNKKCYEVHHDGGTPFLSFYQPCSWKMKTIYDMTHQKFPSIYRYEIRHDRIWVMNIHENNVSNRLFDWMTPNEIEYHSSIPGCI